MLASTWFDMVVGVDIHFEMVPTPAPVPTPFPHPFVGLVFDPVGLAVGLALSNAVGLIKGGSLKGPVLINSMPASNTGTEAVNKLVLPHFVIPPGTAWTPMPKAPKPKVKPGAPPPPPDSPVAPAGDAVLITGSKTVHVMGSNQCRLGDLAMSCSEPVRLPSSVVLTIPKGPPVLVGGPPAVDWMAAAQAFIKTKTVANYLHGLVGRIKNQRLRNLLHWSVCKLTGHPIDVATGRMMTWATDFELPGPMPLVFERHYASSWSDRDSPLGWGWSHSLDQAVWIELGRVVYRAEDGREIEFDTCHLRGRAMQVGDEIYEPLNRLTLRCSGTLSFQIESHDGRVREFAAVRGDAAAHTARLVKIRDRAGHEIRLEYAPNGRLEWVRDSAGRLLRFEHDARGRLLRVSLPHPSQDGWVVHTRYEYSPEGDLVAVIDPLGHATRFEYVGHLMVRETDRTGLSYYFGYDGLGASAYCVRTWGEGGIFDHEITYDKAGRTTAVTNSLGHTSIYRFNEVNLLVSEIDPMGAETRYAYDELGRKVLQVDPLGHETRYAYDARGNLVETVAPDGAVLRVHFDEANNPIEVIDPMGARWRWRYDSAGRLVEQVTPTGEATRWGYEGGLLAWVELPGGGVARYERDARGEVSAVHAPGGGVTRYQRDALGRVVRVEDARGAVHTITYDAAGRAVRVEGPLGRRSLRYDAEGNLQSVREAGREVRFGYKGAHWLAWRREGGDQTLYEYDSEGNLLAVVNELGERHSFVLDACGRVCEETTFDGRTRRYTYDAAGRLVRLERGAGRVTEFEYDAAGRLLLERHSDGTFARYAYREDGELIEASNQVATVHFERDALGRVLRERMGEYWVSSRYDASGERVEAQSSLGGRWVALRDASGTLRALSVGERGRRRIEFEVDAYGLESARKLPGEITASWQRDAAGRPGELGVSVGPRRIASRLYQWRGPEEIAAIEDSVFGRSEYTHDLRGRVASELFPGGEVLHRCADGAGNVSERPDRADRVYAPGGRLLETAHALFEYDADGRLIARHDAAGVWRYRWDDADMLTEVERPDGVRVRFAYDALGRRLAKWCLLPGAGGDELVENAVHWIWDGPVPLHEVRADGELTTWLFEPEGFGLLGKLDGETFIGVVSDHLGTPSRGFDERGQLAWQFQLDVYGVPHGDVQAVAACPWRFPGQYADEETGLYYNNWRYYDPSLGSFISPDPAGLEGGFAPYAYVPDPLVWIDPLGLAACSEREMQLAEIRQEYASKVAALREVANKMLVEGHSEEFVARTVHRMRRELGQQYKHLTPLPQRLMIYVRNIAPRWMGGAGYDSIWGPSVEWLRTKARPPKSWADIIESASRSNQAINQRFGVR